jgi:hypothetical protein
MSKTAAYKLLRFRLAFSDLICGTYRFNACTGTCLITVNLCPSNKFVYTVM